MLITNYILDMGQKGVMNDMWPLFTGIIIGPISTYGTVKLQALDWERKAIESRGWKKREKITEKTDKL